MVDSVGNILNQIGGNSSGINTRQLVDDLVKLERAPQDQRLDAREERLEAQISGIGMLRSAMDELQTALGPLADPETFDAKQAAIPNTNLMAISKLGADSVPGNYRLRIEQVAQSHSVSSGAFESLNAPIGEGSLTLRLGGWENESFTVDPSKTGATINIDSSNNTLAGLRDAINKSGIGVQASIVGKEGSYQLLLTSPTGATNELEITAEETPGEPGLAAFNFNTDSQNLTQHQQGLDAIMTLNGFQVTRDSNTITDVIDGVEFDIFNSNPNEEININITADRSTAEEAIRNFVEAYNIFQKEMSKLTGFNSEEGTEGALRNDSLARNLMQTVRGMMGSAVPGIEDGFNTLASLGIRTKLNGSLEIVENGSNTDFRAAMDNNFDMVRRLFVPTTSSDNSRVEVTGHSRRTQPGNYEVEITQQATRGALQANPVTAGFPLDTTGKDYSFTIRVNGKDAEISIPEGRVFDNGEELAAELQTLINLDSNLKSANAAVNVVFDQDTQQLTFESRMYGRESRVSFRAVGADAAELGIEVGNGVVGKDVQGTINGKDAFGFGNVLRGAVGTPAEGLSMLIAPGATTATVNFSGGFGSNMATMMDTYLRNSGLLSERESNIRDSLKEVDEDREKVDRRSEAFRARQEAQFRAMEQIIRSLNSTGDFLKDINDRLPFTAPKR
ncbi:flagellar filament capping protein FliD [Marinimicrobium sp. ABcell2]|uniref:flagellar filament capping protein FliD n=1 Tax=Marinimicrobium sp. ABcell2 TaxID=3069751 RepID=UPI0027B1FDDB|nr:flagellar filament capping protein FliD [Marinimicrobium sp. ABcell2]MDQ2077348.1 flagellar filament capping protein FliD [Marinimicrobium sp. ABcell2]